MNQDPHYSSHFQEIRTLQTQVDAYQQCWSSIHNINHFLGPRGPLVLPLVACTPARKKNLDHNIYRHTCLMNHQKTRLTSLMAPWDPLDALLDPLAPPGPPMNPLGPLNRSLGLIQTQDHLVCITNHQRTHQMSLPILWNILPLPLDPLGPCRPTP